MSHLKRHHIEGKKRNNFFLGEGGEGKKKKQDKERKIERNEKKKRELKKIRRYFGVNLACTFHFFLFPDFNKDLIGQILILYESQSCKIFSLPNFNATQTTR